MSMALQIDYVRISQELKIRPEILQRLILSFSKTLMDRMKTLEEALMVSDAQKMRAILHEIKGTAGNLRLASISEAEAPMHEAVKANASREETHEYFKVLKSRCEELRDYLAK